MTVQVHHGDETFDNSLAACEVVTVDAAGVERWYRISLSDDATFDDGYLMAGQRIEPEPPEGEVAGPSQRAWDAAREHFRDRGFEVHES